VLKNLNPQWPTDLEPIIGPLCDLLALEPRPHWWEVLRLRVLPRVPEKITLVTPHAWRATRQSFSEGIYTDFACSEAAAQLLFDIGLWLLGIFEDSKESPFAALAELTRHIDSAPLRVAHCLRDLAYGDESRTKDLIAMVQSEDPTYRRLFEAAFWRDREPEPPPKKRSRFFRSGNAA
jgi:hypothetical protein